MSGNSWIAHIKAYRQEHPHLSYKEAMKEAKSTYKKGKGLEGDDLETSNLYHFPNLKHLTAKQLAYLKKMYKEHYC